MKQIVITMIKIEIELMIIYELDEIVDLEIIEIVMIMQKIIIIV
jgi:hypothetical protein